MDETKRTFPMIVIRQLKQIQLPDRLNKNKLQPGKIHMVRCDNHKLPPSGLYKNNYKQK